MVDRDQNFCLNCISRNGGPTLNADAEGNRIYQNGCNLGYQLTSTSEFCVRPDACIRHNEKELK